MLVRCTLMLHMVISDVAAALCLTGLTHIYSAGRGSYGYGYQEILNLKDRFRGFEPSEL